MGKTRQIAERMIVERAARCQRIAGSLREIAARLEVQATDGDEKLLADDAVALRELANEVQRL